jgi:xylitol oxidase
MPSAGAELQSEYFVARSDAHAALRAVAALRKVLGPALQVSEVRSVAADELWLSPAQGRDTLAVHFTWVRDERVVAPAVAAVEAALAPFGARPHWGKVSTIAPDVVAARYERLPDFRRLAAELDPDGKFTNAFLAPYLAPLDEITS